MNLVMSFSKVSKYMVVLLLLIGLVVAQISPRPGGPITGGSSSSSTDTSTSNLIKAMKELCNTSVTILGATIVVLTVVAALVYAAGQIMGAETRARAAVWATAMITGVIIGAILYVLLPSIIATIVGTGVVGVGSTNPCDFTASTSTTTP